MIKALAHVCVFTKDLKRTRDFYCKVLGFKPHFEFLKDGQLFGFYLKIAPRQFIEFFKVKRNTKFGGQRTHHFCFEVDDIDAIIKKLKKSRVKVTPKKLGCDQSWQCWCKDPNGADIEFQQYTTRSAQFTRKDCLVDW
jgi:lactoylglutathione lyase/glyoxylase I family protein